MGYRIVYGPEISCTKRKKGTNFRFRCFIASGFLAFAVLVRCFWPEGCEKLRMTVLPEAATEVQLAVETMVTDLSQGSTLEDALTAFCRDVMHLDEAA